MAPALFPARGFPAKPPETAATPAEAKALPDLSGMLVAAPFWGVGSPWGDITDPLPEVGRGLAAYRLSSLVYACMRFRATKLSEPPLWVYEEEDDGEAPIEGDHPLAVLLEQPNADMEMSDLLEQTSLYLDAYPAALWVKSRDRAGRVGALYAFAADEFAVEPADGRLYGLFRVQTATGEQRYGPDDVVYFRHVGGVAPLEAALGHVAIGEQMRSAIRAQLRNAIRPGSVTAVPNELSTAAFERLKAEMTAFNGGVGNRGRNMVIDNDATWTQVKSMMDELAMGPVQGDVEAAVCQAFTIHPALVGAKIALENSSGLSDTLEPALKQFYDTCAIPTWTKYEKALTRALLREVDPNPLHFIRFVRDDVRALQPDMAEKAKVAEAVKDIWTVNERRAFTDKDASKEPEADEIPALKPPPPQPMPGADPGQARRNTTATGDRPALALVKSRTHPARFDADAYYAVHDAVTRSHEPWLEVVARGLLDRDLAAVLAILGDASGAKALDAGEDDPEWALETKARIPDSLKRALIAIRAFLNDESGVAWAREIRTPLAAVARQAAERAASSVGVRFDVLEPGLEKVIDREVRFLIKHVSATTRDAVKAAITAGVEAGEGVEQIATRVREAGAFGPARARLIARTETTRATNSAQLESMRAFSDETGLGVEAEWYTAHDERVRPEHAAQHGERRPVGQPFTNGRTHPDEPNCRCTLLYHIAGGAESEAAAEAPKSAALPALHVHVAGGTGEVTEIKQRPRVRDVVFREDATGKVVGARITDLFDDEPSNGNGHGAPAPNRLTSLTEP